MLSPMGTNVSWLETYQRLNLIDVLFSQLFHRVIAQSGTALTPWAFQPNPRAMAEKMARAVGINSWSSSQNLIDQLRNVHFWDLTSSQDGWLDLETPRGFGPFDWVPCVEPANVPEQRFLTADPQTLMRSGNFLQMPAIIGYMSVNI